jgi:BirA family biotin operon repressor/biotin-[acetyl-CoA-carboxylase] ligase
MARFDHDYYATRVTSRVGRSVRYFEETGSTMDEARAGADAGGVTSDGCAYVAGLQVAGRGRQGRSWVSEPGAGLYVTYHLVAPGGEVSPLYAVAGAVAAADAVAAAAGLEVDLKWPNDLLHQGRKLAGILAEARHGERVDVFLGIGINVRASALPPEVRYIATSIDGAGGTPPRIEDLLAELSRALEARLGLLERTPARLIEAWKLRLVTLGQAVKLSAPGGQTYSGVAVDVSARGDIVLRHEDGSIDEYSAGDVTTV